MIKEFIPYNLALELKELGFDEPCFGWYASDKSLIKDYVIKMNLKAPIFSQAFRWFREKYKIDSVIIRSFSMTNSYHYNIVIDQDYENNLQSLSIPDRTYEEAELACLRKLIEIVTNEKIQPNQP